MKQLLAKSSLRVWLAIVGSATLVILGSYTIVQQSTRLSADDLPLATAQATVSKLSTGAQPADVVPKPKIDLRNDSNVFVIITDESRHVLASSAMLDGKTPLPPAGTFAFTQEHGTDRFTWQPDGGVRLAARIVTYKTSDTSGFVVTGLSLKQAENRIGTYGKLAIVTWLAVIAWTLFLVMMPERNKKS